MGIIGLLSALMLSNRSTFIILIFMSLLLFLYLTLLDFRENSLTWIKLFSIMLLLFITTYIFFIAELSSLQQSNIPLLNRFAKSNLGDIRLKLWWSGLQHLTTNFWGGKTYLLYKIPLKDYLGNQLSSNLDFLNINYYQMLYWKIFNTKNFTLVHNLWLDIHYESGIFPFCFLILFHIMHIKSFLSLIFQKKRKIIGITVLCIGITMFFHFMIEPIMLTASRLFMASCFLLAYFRQISKTTQTPTKHLKK